MTYLIIHYSVCRAATDKANGSAKKEEESYDFMTYLNIYQGVRRASALCKKEAFIFQLEFPARASL